MAPATGHSLSKRYGNCYYDEFGYENCSSGWNSWGRWVALAVIVVLAIIIALLFSCWNNRRRRRYGAPPMYGTGWIPGSKPPGYSSNNNNPNQHYYGNHQPYNGGAPAPPYSAQPMPGQATGTSFNSNDGYYGNHAGIELQQPQGSYQPQREVYEPPQGPPPGKEGKNNVIR